MALAPQDKDPVDPETAGQPVEGTADSLKTEEQLRKEKELVEQRKVRIIRLDQRALQVLLRLPPGAVVEDILPVGVQEYWAARNGKHIALLIRDTKNFESHDESHQVPETDIVYTQHADGKVDFKKYTEPGKYVPKSMDGKSQTHIEGLGNYPSEVSTKVTKKGKEKLF